MNLLRQRKLSVDEMNKLLLDRVPFKERMDAVYLPIVAQDCACYLCDDLIATLRRLKMSRTIKICRELVSTITEYRNTNRSAMGEALFRDVSDKSQELYKWIGQDMLIHVLQYSQELYHRGINLGTEITQAVSKAYVIRKIVRYVIKLDRDFSARISSYLPKGIDYVATDNVYCVKLDKVLTSVFTEFGTPDPLDSLNIQLSYQVFQNRIRQFHVGYEVHNLNDKEKEMYDKGYCRCTDCSYITCYENCGYCETGGRYINTPTKKKCWRKCKFFKE